jgi:hypothetical protein
VKTGDAMTKTIPVPKPIEQQNCGSCGAFRPDATNVERGWCHFWPPVVFMTVPVGTNPQGNPESLWPKVRASDWCAQWKNIV